MPASLVADTTFEKTRYSSVKQPIEVGVRLTITDSKILIRSTKVGRKMEPVDIEIPFSSIDSMSYELAERHRTKEGAAVMGVSLGAGAVLMATKTKSYWLDIESHEGDAKQSTVLRLDKSEYKDVISTLERATGKQITLVESKGAPFNPTAGSKDIDEVIAFRMDDVVPALKLAMENEGCIVKHSTASRLECNRKRGVSERTGGGEKVTATLEAEGEQTHVRIWTGKHFSERTGRDNWSTPVYNEMLKSLQKPAQTATAIVPGTPALPPAPQPGAQPAAPVPAETESPATVLVKSTPDGADITVDGKFVGNTPSTLRLSPGGHTILIEKSGMKAWQRTMTVSPGGNVTIDATLEKAQ
jgi:hypothetical protein